MSGVSPSMGSCKGDDIEEPGLQGQGAKALYPEGEVRHTPTRMLSCPQSGRGYCHGREPSADFIVSASRDRLARPAGPYDITSPLKKDVDPRSKSSSADALAKKPKDLISICQ